MGSANSGSASQASSEATGVMHGQQQQLHSQAAAGQRHTGYSDGVMLLNPPSNSPPVDGPVAFHAAATFAAAAVLSAPSNLVWERVDHGPPARPHSTSGSVGGGANDHFVGGFAMGGRPRGYHPQHQHDNNHQLHEQHQQHQQHQHQHQQHPSAVAPEEEAAMYDYDMDHLTTMMQE